MSLPDTLFILSDYVGVGTLFRLMRVSKACSALRNDLHVWAGVTRRMQLKRPLDANGVQHKLKSTVRCRECGAPRVPREGPRVCVTCASLRGGYSELIPFNRVREMTRMAKDDRGFVRSHRSLEKELRVIRRTRLNKRLVWRVNVEALLGL